MTDWYERRDELEPEQIFASLYGPVKLDRRVPGDGTRWYVASWSNGYTLNGVTVTPRWSYDDTQIEPGDLIDRLPNDWKGNADGNA